MKQYVIALCTFICGAAGYTAGAATWYVAPGGTGDGTSASSPFGSVWSAYYSANQGDIVQMAGGNYTNLASLQQKAAAATWTQNVTFQPAPGASVNIGGAQWTISGKRITLKGLRFTTRVHVERTATYFRMEECHSQPAAGQIASLCLRASESQVINNTFAGSSGDCDGLVIASGSSTLLTTNVLVEGNTIKDYVYASGNEHEDGIQMYDCANITIRNNVIRNVGNSCIILSPGGASQNMDNVRIENNFIDKGASTSSSVLVDIRYANGTNIKVLNNTILGSANPVANTGNVFRNNILSWLSTKDSGEQYNYIYQWNSGIGVAPSSTSRTGSLPQFANAGSGDLHISQANTVDLAFGYVSGAPATDIDGDTRSTPIWVGADQVPDLIAYEGFGYALTTAVNTAADVTSDLGWTGTTWSSSNDVVAGLTHASLPYLGNALQFTSNVAASRAVASSAMPSTHSVIDSDGVKRLGVAGTELWIAFLIRVDSADTDGSKTAWLSLVGNATGGATKLVIGDVGSNGNWALAKGSTVASSTSAITVGQTKLLVARITYVSGSNNDTVRLYVNPTIGATPPSTASATLTGVDIGAFHAVEFKGSRQSTGDELAIATSWKAVAGL